MVEGATKPTSNGTNSRTSGLKPSSNLFASMAATSQEMQLPTPTFLPIILNCGSGFLAVASRSMVLNHPYIFEVAEPDIIELPQEHARQLRDIQARLRVNLPAVECSRSLRG